MDFCFNNSKSNFQVHVLLTEWFYVKTFYKNGHIFPHFLRITQTITVMLKTTICTCLTRSALASRESTLVISSCTWLGILSAEILLQQTKIKLNIIVWIIKLMKVGVSFTSVPYFVYSYFLCTWKTTDADSKKILIRHLSQSLNLRLIKGGIVIRNSYSTQK